MANILNSNPELKRNLWLEMQPNRLLIMPFIITLIYIFAYFFKGYDTSLAEALMRPSLLIFGVLVYIWGNRQASEAVIGEVNDETWSFQRMTSIGPWQMAIGKLFGSTAYTWYGAAYAVLVYVICSLFEPNTFMSLKLMGHLILVGIFSHALCIGLSLIGIRKNAGKAKIKSTFYFVVALLFSTSMASNSIGLFAENFDVLKWFGIKMSIANFTVITLLLYTFWSIVGLYRNMRTELQFDNKPWVWLSFLVCVMLFQSGMASSIGFLETKHQIIIGGYIALMIPLALTYFMVFSEPKDMINFRRIMDRWKKKDYDDVLHNIPLWLVSFLVTVVVGIALFVYMQSAPMSQSIIERLQRESLPLNFTFIPFNLLLFMTRDVAILLFLNLADNKKRADMTALLYLVVLYGLLPGILAGAGLHSVVPAFWPIYPDMTLINSTILVAIQAVVAVILLGNRWGVKNNELSIKYQELT